MCLPRRWKTPGFSPGPLEAQGTGKGSGCGWPGGTGKLGHQPLFPAQSLVQGEGRNPQRQGPLEVAGASAHPYHGVLVIDFNDNDGGIVS